MGEDDSRRMRMDSVSHQGDQGRQGKEPMVNQVCYSCASRSAPLIYMGFFFKKSPINSLNIKCVSPFLANVTTCCILRVSTRTFSSATMGWVEMFLDNQSTTQSARRTSEKTRSKHKVSKLKQLVCLRRGHRILKTSFQKDVV